MRNRIAALTAVAALSLGAAACIQSEQDAAQADANEAAADTGEAAEDAGAALTARLRSASCALEAGDVERALVHAHAVLEVPADVVADDLYPAERWWILARVFEAAGLAAQQQEAIAAGRDWVQHTARSQVGEPFRDSFLHRNPVNRALLALAGRLGPG